MSGVMNPVPAGLPSQSIFLTPPASSFLFSAAAPEGGAAAASPNPETRVAKRPANALRVKRLESTCVSPFRFSCYSKTLRQCKAKDVSPRGNRNVLFSQGGVSHRRSVNRLSGGEMPKRRSRFRIHSFERLRIVAEEDQSPRRAHGSSSPAAFASLRIFPGELAAVEILCPEALLRLCATAVSHSRGILGASSATSLQFHTKSSALL